MKLKLALQEGRDPEERFRDAYRRAKRIVDGTKGLDPEGQAKLLALTLEQLLSEEDRPTRSKSVV